MYQTQPLAHHDKCEEIEQETDGLLLHCDPAMPHSPLCLTPLYHPPIPSTYTKDEEGYVWLAGREDTTSCFFDFSSWETGFDRSSPKRWDRVAEGASPFDIEAWVQRSTVVRRQEQPQASNGGRVKRLQNAFMLWRKAYRNSIKALYFDRNPKPNFSKVCGELWLLEPAETRVRFKQWAEIEKKNHKTAFPDYVFSTSRTKGAKRGGAALCVG
ncbi:hypothetical protein PG995_004761 [Apiospora arundinis]